MIDRLICSGRCPAAYFGSDYFADYVGGNNYLVTPDLAILRTGGRPSFRGEIDQTRPAPHKVIVKPSRLSRVAETVQIHSES